MAVVDKLAAAEAVVIIIRTVAEPTNPCKDKILLDPSCSAMGQRPLLRWGISAEEATWDFRKPDNLQYVAITMKMHVYRRRYCRLSQKVA